MTLQLASNPYTQIAIDSFAQYQRSQVKQEVGRRIHTALQSAKDLPPDQCLGEIASQLLAIQKYCELLGKTFVVIEEQITCNSYELGGCAQDQAILFRGPSEDASVAICVTHQGSLLHRNSSSWQIYRNVGDVCPLK
jgi:hypothetical protein